MSTSKLIEASIFFDYLKNCSCEHLFNDECYRRLENVRQQYGHLLSDYVVVETALSDAEFAVDYDIRQMRSTFCGNHDFLELDYEACAQENIIPCYNTNISKARDVISVFRAAREILPRTIPREVVVALWPQLRKIASLTFANHGSLYEINYMKSRNPGTKLKIFLQNLTPEGILNILKGLDWDGSLTALEASLTEYVRYAKDDLLMIDFEFESHRISSKVGINISLKNQHETLAPFLDFLIGKGLCLPEKASDVIKFVKTAKSASPCIRNDIADFKMPFVGDMVTMAKVYLGVKAL